MSRPVHGNAQAVPLPYAELHAKTNFSFLEGASHPAEMVQRAAELGYRALAATDRGSLAGVVRAHGAAKDLGFHLLIGAEVEPEDAPPVVLLATDRPAYGRLCRLLTRGRRNAPKGECRLAFADVAEFSAGLIACVVRGETPELHAYRDCFGERAFLLAELLRGDDDAGRLDRLQATARQTGLPLVAAGDVHHHAPERQRLQHLLTAIRTGEPIGEDLSRLFPNAERHLRSLAEIADVYRRIPEAVARTVEIAERCTFSLDELRYDYPRELAPAGETPIAYLKRLAWEGAARRYDNIPDKVCGLLRHELALIEDLRYEAYFLTVYDLVRFAREQAILCQGRGSAANSAVCYCLGVTEVDPAGAELLFERFLSRERNEVPDIDVDFEHERREEVLQYLYQKYGRDRAALAATVITYKTRSAVRDVGKALGLSQQRVDHLSKQIDARGSEASLSRRLADAGVDVESRLGRDLVEFVDELIGFPRHLSQHVGGMVMTESPLCELAPIENAAMADRTVIEWDKDDLDELGILKVDCLCLGMLTAIRKCFDLLERQTGRRLTLEDIPTDDEATFEMIRAADTVGVFQIESRAQMSMLPRLRPRCLYDLVIQVAIVRPGPIQGGMVHPYLRRRNGEETVEYASEEIKHVLQRTLGVPLFQEQAMQLAVVAAGFTPGEADGLRRAMAAWRRPGLIDQFRQKLINGMLAKGHSEEFADRLFAQIRGFGEYGFPESHAASFARLAYASSWLKCHHPAAYTAAMINSWPLGFYQPAQLIRDLREHGGEVRPVDVNHSHWDCTLERSAGNWPALRLGLRLISGLPATAAERVVQLRSAGYRSVSELAHRTGVDRRILEMLARADCFASLGVSRRQALWDARGEAPRRRDQPLFGAIAPPDDAPCELPAMSDWEHVLEDYRRQGFSLRAHPMSFFRDDLAAAGVTTAAGLAELPDKATVKVAGLVLLRQRPSTAAGITFVTLEDETGSANLVVYLKTWERFGRTARTADSWIATGRIDRAGSVIHIVVQRIEDCRRRIAAVPVKSRDFR